MKKKQDDMNSVVDEEQQDETKVIRPPLAVRDEDGKWTTEYTRVWNAVLIPIMHLLISQSQFDLPDRRAKVPHAEIPRIF